MTITPVALASAVVFVLIGLFIVFWVGVVVGVRAERRSRPDRDPVLHRGG